METAADALRAQGRNVYTIPGGGSNPTGALGYVNCAFEMLSQFNDRSLRIDHIVHATGSAGTQAGLVAGLQAMNARIPLLGIGVRAPRPKQEDNVYALARATADKLGCSGVVRREDVVAKHRLRRRRLRPADGGRDRGDPHVRRTGGDPARSGFIRRRGRRGLVDLIRKGHFKKGERVVFLHYRRRRRAVRL